MDLIWFHRPFHSFASLNHSALASFELIPLHFIREAHTFRYIAPSFSHPSLIQSHFTWFTCSFHCRRITSFNLHSISFKLNWIWLNWSSGNNIITVYLFNSFNSILLKYSLNSISLHSIHLLSFSFGLTYGSRPPGHFTQSLRSLRSLLQLLSVNSLRLHSLTPRFVA